jgi:hypothetical protein
MENLLNSRKQAVREDGKVIQLIQGRIAPRQGYPDLYRLAPCKMRLMCRYGLNMEGFGPLDKFLVRADCDTDTFADYGHTISLVSRFFMERRSKNPRPAPPSNSGIGKGRCQMNLPCPGAHRGRGNLGCSVKDAGRLSQGFGFSTTQ